MKVLMYGWEFPPNINGGLGIACYEIVQALLKQQIQIHLVLPHAMQASSHSTIDNLETCTPLTTTDLNIQFVDSILKPYMDNHQYTKSHAATATDKPYASDLFKEVERYAYIAGTQAKTIAHDVIHAHDWLTILAGIQAKKISKKPLFFHVHSLEVDRAGEHLNQAIVDIEQEGLHHADKIIAVSELTRQNIIKHYDVLPHKIVVAYNGIPNMYLSHRERTVKLPAQSKLVLFLGRITHQKGPFYFIEAANKILSVRQDIHFAVAGDGDLLPSLIEQVARLRIGANVHFLGFLGREHVHTIYEQSQVYVMPSVSEPFGLTCLEALTLNVPVVLSKQAGVSEVLNHILKVDYWDTQGLAEKIMALIDYPVLSLTTLKDSQHDLSLLNWDLSVQSIIDSYYAFY